MIKLFKTKNEDYGDSYKNFKDDTVARAQENIEHSLRITELT